MTLIIGSFGSSNSQLYFPYGVLQDPNTKTLYIADCSNNRVMSYASVASTGNVVAGGNGSGISTIQLYNPIGIYLDSFTSSLVIANYNAHNVVRWTLGAPNWTLVAGSSSGISGNSSTMFGRAAGVTLDPMGNVYVADTENHRIQFFPAGQTVGTTIAGISDVSGSNSNQLYVPYTVRLDNQLNLYVTDTGNHRIQKFLRY
jgi:sugar lactone lactonase YvrE